MLFTETLDERTLGLLKKIQKLDGFENLRLVGGSSLGLQLGHRKSIDLDLFGKIELEKDELIQELQSVGKVNILSYSTMIKIFMIDNIKVDIVYHKYPWMDDFLFQEDIKLATMKDIALMKLSAITNRGAKKDFIDLFYLLDIYSIDELFSLYEKKYQDGSIFLVSKSLLYFEDANNEEMPQMLNDISWEDIKYKIIEKYKSYNKSISN